MAIRPKITPFLWYDGQAEEAARFYVGLFPGSEILNVTRYGPAGPGPAGTVMTVEFQLAGLRLVGLNGGPQFKFNEAISLQVDCKDQAEADDLWARLTAGGGQEGQCGWLKDRWGLSWQIVPAEALAVIMDPDPARSQRALKAMMQMKKLDAAALRRAASGGEFP